jgi:hypothetical protein
MILLSRYLPRRHRTAVDTVIQKNGYYAHPENMLVSMATDRRPTIRKKAADLIIAARQRQAQEEPGPVRHFIVPQINFDAKDYTEMVQLDAESVTAPPILREIPDHDLQKMIIDGNLAAPLLDLPIHTQAVERHVQLVTAASIKYVKPEDRDGSIRAVKKSRKIIPSFKCKKEYNPGMDAA